MYDALAGSLFNLLFSIVHAVTTALVVCGAIIVQIREQWLPLLRHLTGRGTRVV